MTLRRVAHVFQLDSTRTLVEKEYRMSYRYYACPGSGRRGWGFISSSGSFTGYLGSHHFSSYNPYRR